jgi:hypothetical protein
MAIHLCSEGSTCSAERQLAIHDQIGPGCFEVFARHGGAPMQYHAGAQPGREEECDMAVGKIIYFEKAGPQNTEAVAEAVRERAVELGIGHVVAASNTGATALTLWEELKDTPVSLIAVPEHYGFRGEDKQDLSDEQRRALEEKGIKVLICAHALSGVGRSVSEKFGGISHVEIIAHTLRRFGGDGIKVGVEVSIMAADAGLVPTDREIVAVGGSGKGADSAIVLKAAHMNNFFSLDVREIIAKPRQRGTW